MASFTYDDLAVAISPARANRYLRSTADPATGRVDRARAVRLYEVNAELSASVWSIIADVEVVLRNIVAEAITAHHSTVRPGGSHRWYDAPSWFPSGNKWFSSRTQTSIQQAMSRVGDPGPGGPRPPEGRVVAELTLGFWRYLLVARYEHSLWNPAIRHSFVGLGHLSGADGRKAVYSAVERLNYLRNRVAHHEPIYEAFTIPGHSGGPIDCRAALDGAIEMVSWANPTASKWIADRSVLTGRGRLRQLSDSASALIRPRL